MLKLDEIKQNTMFIAKKPNKYLEGDYTEIRYEKYDSLVELMESNEYECGIAAHCQYANIRDFWDAFFEYYHEIDDEILQMGEAKFAIKHIDEFYEIWKEDPNKYLIFHTIEPISYN